MIYLMGMIIAAAANREISMAFESMAVGGNTNSGETRQAENTTKICARFYRSQAKTCISQAKTCISEESSKLCDGRGVTLQYGIVFKCSGVKY
jgi:hypothetical protein